MKNEAQMSLHNVDGFIDIKSLGLLGVSMILNAINTSPLLQFLSALVMISTLVYNAIKIYTSIHEHRNKKRSNANSGKGIEVPGTNGDKE